MVRCVYCWGPLRFTERGWVHEDGGVYQKKCAACGWRGAPYPEPTACPNCESPVWDHHCALPDKWKHR